VIISDLENTDQEIEVNELKKKKLQLKDQMQLMITQYQGQL